jgi:flagellar biosynthesis GTPase FlhF
MMQMGGAQPGQPGFFSPQPPQPPSKDQLELLKQPSWEDVMALLRDRAHRCYRIDIETDSTIAGSLEADMAGLGQILQAVSSFMKETMPLVQAGALPVDAQKEMLMAITRRARMGLVVEDALDKMQPPQQSGPPPQVMIAQMKAQADAHQSQVDAAMEQQKMQMQAQLDERAKQVDLQIEQQRLAMEERAEQQRQQNEMMVEQHKQEMQAQQIAHQNQLEAQREQLRHENELRFEQFRMMMEAQMKERDRQIEILITQMNNAAKVEVAEIAAATTLQAAQESAANQAADDAGAE